MLSNIGPVQLLIVLVIVVLIFGTRKLRNAGKDIGEGIKGVRQGFGDEATISDVAEELGEARREIKSFKDKVGISHDNSSKKADHWYQDTD